MDTDALEKMLAAGTNNAMLRFTLGKAYFDRGEFERAVVHLEAAVEHDAGYSAAWKWRGRAELEAGHPDKARETFMRGIAVAEEKGDKQAVKEMQVFLRRIEKSRKGE